MKSAFDMEECALEMGEVQSLKPLSEAVGIVADTFQARYAASGMAEHSGDVESSYSSIIGLTGKTAAIPVAGVSRTVEISSVTIGDTQKGEPEDGDGEFSVRIPFTLHCRLA